MFSKQILAPETRILDLLELLPINLIKMFSPQTKANGGGGGGQLLGWGGMGSVSLM